jgi:hypothetical protein
MPVPLREGDQFLPEGGWQSILYNTREQTRAMADLHTTFAHSITHSVLHTLNHVKNDIKIVCLFLLIIIIYRPTLPHFELINHPSNPRSLLRIWKMSPGG